MVPLFCFFFALIGWTLQAAPQEPPLSDEYVLRVWDANEGLPNNHVSGLAQTPDGYLWIATWWGGLVRFDGVHFTPISLDAALGTGETRVHTVFTARDGTLWIGLERGGVARKRGDRFEMIVPPAAKTESVVLTSSIVEDASGAIWFAYNPNQEVFRLAGERLSGFSLKQGVTLGSDPFVHVDGKGNIWFSARSGCAIFKGDRFQAIDFGNVGGRLAPEKGGGMWAMRGNELIRYGMDGTKEVVSQFSWLDPSGGVYLLYSDREGNLWIGTRSKGLFRYRDGVISKVPTSHSAILSITEDREGNLWVGTEGGLNRLRPSPFSLRQSKHGLLHDSVVALCEDSEGKLWLVGRDGTPVRSVDSSNQQFAVPPGWGAGAVMAIHPDPNGGVWLGLLGDLVHWKDGAFSPGRLHEQITALQVDGGGDLWISSIHGGVIRKHDDQYERYPTTGGVVLPRALALDAAGKIWVGTEEGRVFYRENDQFVPVPIPNAKAGQIIRFIVADGKDSMWIGAFGGGLYRWKNGQVSALPREAGLPLSDLRSLIIAPEGDFWFGAGQGLFRVPRAELNAAVDGVKSAMHTFSYGRDDGVPSAEFSFGFRNATARTRDGHIWFATYSGALEIAPERLKPSEQPVPVLIEGTHANGTASSFIAGLLTFPPHPGPIQIEYTQPQLRSPDQIRFRYRLVEGAEEPGWIEAGTQRSVTFPRLGPGTYRFEVEASDSSEEWSVRPAVQEFRVRAAWWETIGFRLLVGILAAVGLSFVVRAVVKRRMQARIRKLEQEHALERERTRIARDIHDELGASLTQISMIGQLSKFDPAEEGPEHIQEMTSIAQRAVMTLDEIVWAVNPRNDTLASLIQYLGQYAVDFLAASGIACRVEAPRDLPGSGLSAPVRHNLFLAIKEALTNIAKYSKASEVQLCVELADRTLQIVVSDNGCGFEQDAKRIGSDGLINMRERMGEVGGSCQIKSHRGEGTRITFQLTLP